MKKQTATLNPKICVRIAERSKADIEAFLFVTRLASFVKHPILLNYKANITAYRLLLGLTDHRYRQLVNNALRLGYARVEGNHLRLFSKTQQRRRFRINHHYDQAVKISEIRDKFYLFVLDYNVKSQHKAINYKVKAAFPPMAESAGADTITVNCNNQVNFNVTMSVRKCASLLKVSLFTANNLLKRLHGHGLTITDNIVVISKQEFRQRLWQGCRGIRYTNGQYLLITARTIKMDRLISNKGFEPGSMNYCAI